MFSWIETIRKKSESTRRAVAVVIFIACAGIVVTLWLWNLQGSFPYGSFDASRQSVSQAFDTGIKNFQDLRLKLGELKQNILDAASGTHVSIPLEKAE